MLCTLLPLHLGWRGPSRATAAVTAARNSNRRLLSQTHGDLSSRTDNILLTCIFVKSYITRIFSILLNVYCHFRATIFLKNGMHCVMLEHNCDSFNLFDSPEICILLCHSHVWMFVLLAVKFLCKSPKTFSTYLARFNHLYRMQLTPCIVWKCWDRFKWKLYSLCTCSHLWHYSNADSWPSFKDKIISCVLVFISFHPHFFKCSLLHHINMWLQ